MTEDNAVQNVNVAPNPAVSFKNTFGGSLPPGIMIKQLTGMNYKSWAEEMEYVRVSKVIGDLC